MRTGLLPAAAAFLCLAACSTPQQGDTAEVDGDDGWVEVAPDSIRAISAPHTPLYRYGPSQATGPDTLLKKDALVSVVKKEFGFSRVRTEDNVEGYVANDRLTKAPEDHPPFGMSASMGMGLLPEYRTDTTGAPEWLEVGTVDQMLIENPPGELLMPEGVDEPPPAEPTPSPVTPEPAAAPAAEPAAPSSSTTPNSNG